jgi:hypothetical protein
VLWILEAELGRDSELRREPIFARQRLAIEPEGELRLRVQRGRHVDAGDIIVVAAEGHIFGVGVGADPRQEIREANAGPFADRAPSLNADMPRDLGEPRQRMKRLDGPRLLVLGETRDVEMEVPGIDHRRLVLGIKRIERKRPCDRAFLIFGRELVGIEEKSLRSVVEIGHALEHPLGGDAIDDIAAGKKRQRTKPDRIAQEQSAGRQIETAGRFLQDRAGILVRRAESWRTWVLPKNLSGHGSSPEDSWARPRPSRREE